MKKTFKFFLLIWVIVMLLFNAVTFIVPQKHDGAFWVGYIFIILELIGQLICGYITFKAKNVTKLFYNIPIIRTSFISIAIMAVLSVICMLVPALPVWIGVVGCLIVLAFSAISINKAVLVSDIVEDIDTKIDVKTFFIKDLTVKAESLMNKTNVPILKAKCKEVYEAVKFSDPMSSGELANIEKEIKEEFDAFTDAVLTDDLEATEVSAKELIAIIKERNDKCRLLK